MCGSCTDQSHEVRSTHSPVIALIGRPNVGKSTLFTRLSGIHRKIGNWPATTVEVGTAEFEILGKQLTLLDLPGTCGLDPNSPDEKLTCDLLLDGSTIDLGIVLVDASNIARCLYLVSELKEIGIPLLVALTMNDIAVRRNIKVDLPALAQSLGLPVIPVVPRTGKGLAELEKEIVRLADLPLARSYRSEQELTEDQRIEFVEQVLKRTVARSGETKTLTDKTDRILTAPFLGVISLLVVLWGVFQATTTLAAPLQRLISGLVDQVISPYVSRTLESVPWLQGVVVQGIIAGVGTLLTFLPVMSIMFLILSVLEDSGYMARVAVVSDRLMRFAGLPGRAILPLLVGFGCNVPAVSATRTLSDARHRLILGLTVPFTACSARLAVYLFIAQIFFKNNAGTVLFLMYLSSIAMVVSFSLFLRLTFVKGAPREPLLIELPPYRLPTSVFVFSDAWIRVKGFLREAGGIVITTVIVVWFLMSIPLTGAGSFTNTPVEESAYGVISKAVSPIFAPAGFADWHTTGALITGFVAKEVVITSWAQNYAVDTQDHKTQLEALGANLRKDFHRTSGGHTTAAVLAFLIFLTAYTPCVATVAAQKREFGIKWAILGVGLQLSIAWILAVIVFQVGRLF